MGQGLSGDQRRFLESIQFEGNHEELLEQLRLGGSTLDLKGECGTLAMVLACHFGHTRCAEVLILAGCSATAPSESPPPELFGDEKSVTPLYAAARSGSVSCIKLCLRAGANLELQTSDGHSAMDAVKSSGNVEAIRILQDAPKARAAYEERRNSAYTRAHLGVDRIKRQAIAVHVIDFSDNASGETCYEIESEDNFKSRFVEKGGAEGEGEDTRSIYTIHRTVSEFKRLHKEMCHEYATMPPYAFTMAPKRLTYAEKRERMIQLQDYLRLVLSVVEKAAGGGWNRFQGARPGQKPGRDVAELPVQLVMFLGLEDSNFSDKVRPIIQQLRSENKPPSPPAVQPAAGASSGGDGGADSSNGASGEDGTIAHQEEGVDGAAAEAEAAALDSPGAASGSPGASLKRPVRGVPPSGGTSDERNCPVQ